MKDVNDTNPGIADGEFVILVGPPGCGKSTRCGDGGTGDDHATRGPLAKPALYLSLDASHELLPRLKVSRPRPTLQDILVGRDDSFVSAIGQLFAGHQTDRAAEATAAAGLQPALAGEGAGPLNVFGSVPTVSPDYSPIWDMTVGAWMEGGGRQQLPLADDRRVPVPQHGAVRSSSPAPGVDASAPAG